MVPLETVDSSLDILESSPVLCFRRLTSMHSSYCHKTMRCLDTYLVFLD